MKITKQHLQAAASEDIITTDQAEKLYAFFKQKTVNDPSFNLTHILYYAGGLIAIGAMTLFMNLGWESFGGYGIFLISLVYALIGVKLTMMFQARGYSIPAGICATFVVALTPLAIYGLQQAWGLWPDSSVYRDYHRYIKWHWIYMELGSLVVGSIFLWKYKYPFLVMPIAVTLWYLSMDVAIMIMMVDRHNFDFEFQAKVSMYFGLLMLVLAVWVDIRSKNLADYAFWLYIFGVMTFWGGMTSQNSDSELAKFIYCCINILMIGVGVLIMRRVFVIFGAMGISIYLGHLASHVFKDSWLFPMALTAIGLLIIYLGVLWQKNEQAITQKMRKIIPIDRYL